METRETGELALRKGSRYQVSRGGETQVLATLLTVTPPLFASVAPSGKAFLFAAGPNLPCPVNSVRAGF